MDHFQKHTNATLIAYAAVLRQLIGTVFNDRDPDVLRARLTGIEARAVNDVSRSEQLSEDFKELASSIVTQLLAGIIVPGRKDDGAT